MDKTKLTPPPGGKVVLLFGCQFLSLGPEDFQHLRATVLSSPEYAWILDAIAELPVYYRTATYHIPELRSLPGEARLRDLHKWLLSGQISDDVFPLPYVQSAPLVMITHLTQYVQFMQLSQPELYENGDLRSPAGNVVDVFGLCIGALSASVVSASRTQRELRDHTSVALRLAMLMGAIGDAQEKDEEHTSIATAWKRPSLEQDLPNILRQFPKAYISVHFDENRVTIMTPRQSVNKLKNELERAGFTASQVNLSGRYHWPGYRDKLAPLLRMCARDPSLQLPHPGEQTAVKNHRKHENCPIHEFILRSILSEPYLWREQFCSVYEAHLKETQSILVEFGPERCVPPSFARPLHGRVIHFEDVSFDSLSRMSPLAKVPRVYDDDIAVVGMACRVAGADDLEEFWQLLCSGKSQHQKLPIERYENFETPWRPKVRRSWWGNFVRDIDAFDHKFFKKVPREAVAQDPQQRLILQVAYQALEKAGYFQKMDVDKNVGCYIACCAVDYEYNMNCHPASAYTVTGMLRSFMAGKISHHFGWRGPAFCIDNACSGSAVAVHQACQAILRGECTAALVGGANAILSPLNYDNLAGASFLSPTGPCKPFDARADGYCRGEGVAAIYIKRVSDALANGDTILGTIAATAVEQNDNCTPIVVPDSSSLCSLFDRVTKSADVQPHDITVVEAHGTGTQAGDPAEYSGILQALGGPQRKSCLQLGSVKGLVGHTEGVSGLIALVKVLLMIQEGKIPPQPNFHRLNPHIKKSSDDNIEITTTLKQWESENRAVLINNYGASGSNASMVITPAPAASVSGDQSTIHLPGISLPFRICGLDDDRIRDYATALRQFLRRQVVSARHAESIANLSFNICRQSNPSLDRHLIFRCQSREQLDNKLTAIIEGNDILTVRVKRPLRPVVLCFGSQVSTCVGLDHATYNAMPLLRYHLDKCHSILQDMKCDGLYPSIFETAPISDQVSLQTQLFSLQYACAQSWIDSGLHVSAVIGHSFGELTALCVAGCLSLVDALTLVARRAAIIRDHWGVDSGAMIAVDGELADIEQLISASEKKAAENCNPATISCFNGPANFTIGGRTAFIDAVQHTMTECKEFSHLRGKRLNVTNAFHSALVDPLIANLKDVTDGLTLKQPTIHVEQATEHATTWTASSTFVADHLRQPVYFYQAVQRLKEKYHACVWLEAGSNSTITVMTTRAVGSSSGHHFQPVNITSEAGIQNLTEVTTNLWKESVPVSFWGHHHRQALEYAPILLPPYQFEKSRHWLQNKKLPAPVHEKEVTSGSEESQMISFLGYDGAQKELARFRVHTSHPRYQKVVSGHVVARTTAVAPASMILDTVVEALLSIPEGKGLVPQISNVTSDAPLCLDSSRQLFIELRTPDVERRVWNMKYVTQDLQGGCSSSIIHCQARITLYDPQDEDYHDQWAQYCRLVPYQRCKEVLNAVDADDILQGRNVYPTFAEIVDYGDCFQGVQRLVGKGMESAGKVVKGYTGETWADPYLSDCFSQVGGFWVNCMTERPNSDIYIASEIQKWMRTPRYAAASTPRPDTWEIYATHERHEDHYVSDIFAFDSTTGDLVDVFLGIIYTRVAKTTFRSILGRYGTGRTEPSEGSSSSMMGNKHKSHSVTPMFQDLKKSRKRTSLDLFQRVKSIVADFCAIDPSEITEDGNMADAGIDSLMAMELAKELEGKLSCTLSASDLLEADTFRDLVAAVKGAVGDIAVEVASHEEEIDTTVQNSSPSDDWTRVSLSSSADSEISDIPGLCLPYDTVLEAFAETKALTDRFLVENQCSGRVHAFAPFQMQLCVTLVLEAFEELGCSIRNAPPGQRLKRISFDPQHKPLVDYLYERLEESRLIDLDVSDVVRTTVSAPRKPSSAILEDISHSFEEFSGASQLTFFAGSRLPSVLRGEQDGLQLIFGTTEGQKLVSWVYGNEPHNVTGFKQIIDFIQRVARKLKLSTSSGPLRILELGAGTGGGTKWFLPELAKLGIPVEFTFSDISTAFVSDARRRFREYPFMRYRVYDINKPPAKDLVGTQHIILALNAVHATSNLQNSTWNMRQALRKDGVVMMVEMTRPQFAMDIVFGLLRGWWEFTDGRNHAITSEQRWEADLHAAQYGHVDWTDGHSPEAAIQRVIFATASGAQKQRLPLGEPLADGDTKAGLDVSTRQRITDDYIRRNAADFKPPTQSLSQGSREMCVLVTGSTGSLGSHIAAHLARLPSVKRVFCLNRHSTKGSPIERQKIAFDKRGIFIEKAMWEKFTVYESNTADAQLGLSASDYGTFVTLVTHIIHNAWPMDGVSGLSSFESQFRVMRNLVNLARDIACCQPAEAKVYFQLVSSISVVGLCPLVTGEATVPEEGTTIETVLSNGYSEAKFVCERMLDETLHQYQERFSAMVVRPGQIAGSSTSGHWNSTEHLPALIKSSQTLRVFPNFQGVLSWTPVDAAAAVCVELILAESQHYAVYHIDNPVRQPWQEMIPVLAGALDIPLESVVPFSEWVQRVRAFPGYREDNPAVVMIDWLEEHFERMSCGGLLLETGHARETSPSLATVGPVQAEVVRKYVGVWKSVGFLH